MKLDITGFTEMETLQLLLSALAQRRDSLAAKVDEIKALIATKGGITKAKRGRPAAITAPTPAAAPAKTIRRPLSPEARARISAAQNKRWAKVRKEAKVNGAAAAPKRTRKPLPRVMDDETVDSAMEA